MSCVNLKVCNMEETCCYCSQVPRFTYIFEGIFISEILPWRCWGSYKMNSTVKSKTQPENKMHRLVSYALLFLYEINKIVFGSP